MNSAFYRFAILLPDVSDRCSRENSCSVVCVGG